MSLHLFWNIVQGIVWLGVVAIVVVGLVYGWKQRGSHA